ncbi:MAG: hypothetical protein DI637_09615 [Citromicrobium sp.]|nr:MAG: hypothetical protein DI637_09615 [Citromicrobium sp.]
MKVNLRLIPGRELAQGSDMSGPDDNTTREERLAAKLRENLRRRKGQAREMRESQSDTLPIRDEAS